MQLVRTLASYYRQRNFNPQGRQLPSSYRLPVLRRPQLFSSDQARHNDARSFASEKSNGLLPGRDGATREGDAAPPARTGKPNFFTWMFRSPSVWRRAKWAFGSLFALLLPLWSIQWKKLLLLGGEVENAVKVAETTAEIVEEVAAAAEKLSEEVAEKLPDGGKLKEAATAVENASKAAVAGAQSVEDIIRKVGELETEVERLLKPEAEGGR